jgi:hypothetical protein
MLIASSMVGFVTVSVFTTIFDFLSTHIVLVAVPVSGLWFYAGHQYLAKGNTVGAILWQTIAVLILIAFCINIFLSANRSWLSLAVAVVAIGVEIWIIKSWWQRENARR